SYCFFFFQAEDGIRDFHVTGVQTCALPICAQVGSQVTGVVLERRVKEGDRVEPGDVLAVLRADDLEAAVREARAELAQLEESTRPQAEAALREAEIALTQAARESQRRRALFQERAIPKEELERAVQAEAAARAAA